jgi:hypothetical protein
MAGGAQAKACAYKPRQQTLEVDLFPRVQGIALAVLLVSCGELKATDEVAVKVVKYTDLAQIVSQLKGKVVVIDFWAHW